MHFADRFNQGENLLSVSHLLLNTCLSFFLDISFLVYYNEANKSSKMLKQFLMHNKDATRRKTYKDSYIYIYN